MYGHVKQLQYGLYHTVVSIGKKRTNVSFIYFNLEDKLKTGMYYNHTSEWKIYNIKKDKIPLQTELAESK